MLLIAGGPVILLLQPVPNFPTFFLKIPTTSYFSPTFLFLINCTLYRKCKNVVIDFNNLVSI